MFLVVVGGKKNGGKLEVEVCCHIEELKFEGITTTCDIDVCIELLNASL